MPAPLPNPYKKAAYKPPRPLVKAGGSQGRSLSRHMGPSSANPGGLTGGKGSQRSSVITPGAITNPGKGSTAPSPLSRQYSATRPAVTATDARQRAAQQESQRLWDQRYIKLRGQGAWQKLISGGRGSGTSAAVAASAGNRATAAPGARGVLAPAGPINYHDGEYLRQIGALRREYAPTIQGFDNQLREMPALYTQGKNALDRWNQMDAETNAAALAARGVFDGGQRIVDNTNREREYGERGLDLDKDLGSIGQQRVGTERQNILDELERQRIESENDSRARWDESHAPEAGSFLPPAPVDPLAGLPGDIQKSVPKKRSFFMHRGNRYFYNPGAAVPIARAPKGAK